MDHCFLDALNGLESPLDLVFWLAAGKPISISLNPSLTRRRNISIFSLTTIGSIRAWFPSLRSTLTQAGAFSICLFGHCLSG